MCTVTWLRNANGYEVFCNRDEKLTRGLAAAPRVREREGVRYIAPIDTDFGGTWIASNEFGVTLVLLNAAGPGPLHPKSRGLLILDLIAQRSVESVHTRVAGMPLHVFAPFQLLALDADGGAQVLEWSGLGYSASSDPSRLMPLTSSSFDSHVVCERRRRQFQELVTRRGPIDGNLLLSFHASHERIPDAYSTCMHRPDAATASFSHIRVSPGNTRFFYKAGPLCQPAPMYTASLVTLPYDSLPARHWTRDAAQ